MSQFRVTHGEVAMLTRSSWCWCGSR